MYKSTLTGGIKPRLWSDYNGYTGSQ